MELWNGNWRLRDGFQAATCKNCDLRFEVLWEDLFGAVLLQRGHLLQDWQSAENEKNGGEKRGGNQPEVMPTWEGEKNLTTSNNEQDVFSEENTTSDGDNRR